ncbi:hypothetical protein EV121DRAFT_267912 [Schizophyllum commune]
MGFGEDTWPECMPGLDRSSVDSTLSAEAAYFGPLHDWLPDQLFDQLIPTNPFESTCKPTPKCGTVSDTTFTSGSWADRNILRNASAVTTSPHTSDILAGACPHSPTYASGHPATSAPCPDVALTGLPPSSTCPYFGLQTTFETISSPYVAPDDGSGPQANFRREVGSQAQTEASFKRRRNLAPVSSTYACDRCLKTFTRKKNLQGTSGLSTPSVKYEAFDAVDTRQYSDALDGFVGAYPIIHTRQCFEAGIQWALCADNDGERDDLWDPSDSTSATDEKLAFLNIHAPNDGAPVSLPAHEMPPSRACLEAPRSGAAIKEEQVHPIAPGAALYGMSPHFETLPSEQAPQAHCNHAGMATNPQERLQVQVLPGGALSADNCAPTPSPKFRMNVSTSNRQRATKNRRSLGSSLDIPCTIPGCPMTFTRKQNLKEHLKLHLNKLGYHCETPGCGQRFNTRGLLRSHDRHAHRALSLRKMT